MDRRFDRKSYSLGWICALPLEFAAAIAMLDERHSPLPQDRSDDNTYEFGRIGSYHVIIACLPSGVYGVTSAAIVAKQMRQSFPDIEAALMVGIAGGAPDPPQRDIRLGDVVVSEPVPGFGGVLQYDFGKTVQAGRFVQSGVLNKPPKVFLAATAKLKADSQLQGGSQPGSEAYPRKKNSVYVDRIIAHSLENGIVPLEFARPPNYSDKLFKADYDHPPENDSCNLCNSIVERASRLNDEPYIHYGLIASGNQVMKHGLTRDLLAREKGVSCFEMEAAGIMDELPSLVIRGICDYSDSHKNKVWQPYAALSAAAFAKELILRLPFRAGERVQPERIVLNLPIAEGAAYWSYTDQHKSGCLAGTRVDLLKAITNWIENPEGKTIFWLLGKAGTGKSTISRTVAENLNISRQLAGSFFFNREEGDRRTGARFFTTIATQLANYDFEIGSKIKKAIQVDPDIFMKNLKEQFDKLIFQPLSEVRDLAKTASLVLVVDALDECEETETIKLIIHLLGQLKGLKTVDMRVFLTSREDLPIISGFKKLPGNIYENTALHEIPDIEHDITLFIQDEFDKIREERDDASLPEKWPSEEHLEKLVQRATPLFIYAATLCKFIGDEQWDPEDQIKVVLDYQTEWQTSQLQITYLPVLNQLVVGQNPSQQQRLLEEFRQIVGTIINLASPMSAPSLARLLSLRENTVRCRLRPLQSVLDIPKNINDPIRTFHLSFRDFLLDRSFREKNIFWVDESESHKFIASKCIDLMSGSTEAGLRRNICNLPSPGTLRSEIRGEVIGKHFPPELRYACRYWISHLVRSGHRLTDNGQTHKFLQKHLLHWLEATSLLDLKFEVLRAVEGLRTILNTDDATALDELINDIRRFMLQFQDIIYRAPLQTYASALIFAPKKSIIRTIFDPIRTVPFLHRFPYVQNSWGSTLQTLEGHSGSLSLAVAFSLDGKLLALAEDCITGAETPSIKLWDTITGTLLTTLKPGSTCVATVFSPDSKLLAVLRRNNSDPGQIIQLWDLCTESLLKELIGNHSPVGVLAFSPDSEILASASDDKSVKLWNSTTGTLLRTLEGHSDEVISIAFAPENGKTLTSASHDGTVRVWETDTGDLLQMLSEHEYSPTQEGSPRTEDENENGEKITIAAAAISPKNNRIIALADWDTTIKIWNASTDALTQTFEQRDEQRTEESYDYVQRMAISPNGKMLAAVYSNCTIKLWDIDTGVLLQSCQLRTRSIGGQGIAFSPDGRMLAVLVDNTVKLWDTNHTNTVATGASPAALEEHTDDIRCVTFSPDGKAFASSSNDTTIKLWSEEGNLLRTLGGNDYAVGNILFSPSAEMLASVADDQTIKLWNVATGAVLQILEVLDHQVHLAGLHDGYRPGSVHKPIFSHDGDVFGVVLKHSFGYENQGVLLWDTATGTPLEMLGDGDRAQHSPFAFDADKRRLTDRNGQHLNIFPKVEYRDWNDSIESSVGSNITFRDNWLIRGGERLIWLPHDRRVKYWDRHGSKIVLGHESALLSYFYFKTPSEEI
ncbi:hypothetical protein TWF481_001398 [Arthrobotrys musiformis]|uniref:Nephrocystin 3-like N-terminal domain-containing protein n=1 Tax=Arthrobotrys musiformis TaxID=47236 RepID=A0AAV9WRG1_9PEZI